MDTTSKKPEFDAKAGLPGAAAKPDTSQAPAATDKQAVKVVHPLYPQTGRSM
ncbi:MAG: hypothetical protein PW788_02450 [Micavibrio sp.]|nr:hypothetical protein [Micavibrio sp.]